MPEYRVQLFLNLSSLNNMKHVNTCQHHIIIILWIILHTCKHVFLCMSHTYMSGLNQIIWVSITDQDDPLTWPISNLGQTWI